MGIFSSKEDDAVEQIEKINRRMKTIREIIRRTGDNIVPANALEIAKIIQECGTFYDKYNRIKNGMDYMQGVLFLGRTVNAWNGEKVGVLLWEEYFVNTVHMLTNSIKATEYM